MLIVFFRPFRRRWVPWCGGGGREGQWEVYAEVYAVEGWERHKQKGWSCVCASGVRAFPSEILIFICSPTIDVEQLVCSSQRDAWRPGAGGGVWCRVKEECSWERVCDGCDGGGAVGVDGGAEVRDVGEPGEGWRAIRLRRLTWCMHGYTRCAERSAPSLFDVLE